MNKSALVLQNTIWKQTYVGLIEADNLMSPSWIVTDPEPQFQLPCLRTLPRTLVMIRVQVLTRMWDPAEQKTLSTCLSLSPQFRIVPSTQQAHIPGEGFFLACTWPPSCHMLAGLFLGINGERGYVVSFSSYRDTNPNQGLHPHDFI